MPEPQLAQTPSTTPSKAAEPTQQPERQPSRSPPPPWRKKPVSRKKVAAAGSASEWTSDEVEAAADEAEDEALKANQTQARLGLEMFSRF